MNLPQPAADPMQKPAQTAPQPEAKPSVTIADMGDGTYTVMSNDESTESSAEQTSEGADESSKPIKGIDAALEQAKSVLMGETGANRQQLESIFNKQFQDDGE